MLNGDTVKLMGIIGRGFTNGGTGPPTLCPAANKGFFLGKRSNVCTHPITLQQLYRINISVVVEL